MGARNPKKLFRSAKITKKDARLEWAAISQKTKYIDVLDAIGDSVEEVTEFVKRIENFARNAQHAGLTERDTHRKREGLVQATLQSCRTLSENLQQFTMLLIETNKHDQVVSREWSQRYAGDTMEFARRTAKDYQNVITKIQAARKRLGSLGDPVEPLPDPFGHHRDQMEEMNDEDMEMGEGARIRRWLGL